MPGEKTVKPRYFENNIFGMNIHFDYGECGCSQNVRVPLRDYPVVECKVLNKIPVLLRLMLIAELI